MSITSTRRVSTSLSYSQPIKGGYDVANKNQSFVETIDTANNVLVDDETKNKENGYFNQSFVESENTFTDIVVDESDVVESEIDDITLVMNRTPLLDNDNIYSSIEQNRSVGIYGANQAISNGKEDTRLDNPYLKYFYENNEVIEDIDELV